MTDTYEKYPLTMAHPAYKPATISKGEAGAAHGQPMKFPPVTVRDEMEQEYYEAQGYREAGHVDPSAWADQHSGPIPDVHQAQQYPKWVEGRLVNSIDDDPSIDPEARAAMKVTEATAAASPDTAALMDRIAKLEALLDGAARVEAVTEDPANALAAETRAERPRRGSVN